MPTKLIGNAPYQVPRNSDLGSLAYQNTDNVTVDKIQVDGGVTGYLDAQIGVSGNTRSSVRPSLLLDFANTKTLDPRITFTRSTQASYYSDQTLRAEENILIDTDNLTSSAWAAKTNVDIMTTGETAAPDGTYTAFKLIETTGSGWHDFGQSIRFYEDTPNGEYYTASIYAKKAERSHLYVYVGSGGGSYTVLFDLENGTVLTKGANVFDYAISSAGDGWYRCSVTGYLNGVSTQYFSLFKGFTGQWTGDGVSGVYLWGPQLERRQSPTQYVKSTNGVFNTIQAIKYAPTNTPRFETDPSSDESKGLLVETSKTNLIPNSTNIIFNYLNSYDYWSNTFYPVNVYTNSVIAPDGSKTGNIIEATANGVSSRHVLTYFSAAAAASAGSTYTFSVYVKKGTARYVVLADGGDTPWHTLTFDFESESITHTNTVDSSGVIKCSNGWYRIYFSITRVATATFYFLLGPSNWQTNGAPPEFIGANETVLMWGPQIEAGSYITSYIPSLSTYVGRGSPGTYFSKNGILETVGYGVPRLQPNHNGGTELIAETIGSVTNYWNNSGYTSSYAFPGGGPLFPAWSTDEQAPDGSATAYKVIKLGSRFFQDWPVSTFGMTGGNQYTISFYMKTKGTPHSFNFVVSDSNSDYNRVSKTFYVTNSWQRYSATFIVGNNGGSYGIRPEFTYLAVGDCLWGIQIELGSTMTSYIPQNRSFTSRNSIGTYYDQTGVLRYAPINTPRYTYNPSCLIASPTLLVEGAVTNMLSYSEDYSNAYWAKSNSSVTSNSTASPDGAATADTLTTSANNSYHEIYNAAAIAITANSIYTTSAYFKAGTKQYAFINFQSGAHSTCAVFDLSGTGKVTETYVGGSSGTIYDTSIKYIAAGWYRCTLTASINYTSAYAVFGIAPLATGNTFTAAGEVSYSATSSDTIYIWGTQLENNTNASSYIPALTSSTTRQNDVLGSIVNLPRLNDIVNTAQTTRAEDTAYITGSANMSWVNQYEGTLYGEFDTTNTAPLAGPRIGGLAQTNTPYFISGALVSGSSPSGYFINSPWGNSLNYSSMSSNLNSIDLTKFNKSVHTYKLNGDCGMFVNGTRYLTGTSVNLPKVDTFYIGKVYTSGITNNGHIKKIAYWPIRLNNTEIIGLTA